MVRAAVAAVFAVALLAGTAQARPSGIRSCGDIAPIDGQIIAYQHHAPTPIGYRGTLAGIGRPGYVNPAPAMLASYGPHQAECVLNEKAIAYEQMFATTHRFYVLLAGFPTKPTGAQWTTKWPALVRAAIASDRWTKNVEGGPTCVGPEISEPGHRKILCTGIAGRLVADMNWLTSVESARYGTRVA